MEIFKKYQNDINFHNFKLIFGIIYNTDSNPKRLTLFPDIVLEIFYDQCKVDVEGYFTTATELFGKNHTNNAFINLVLFYDGQLEFLENTFALNKTLSQLK